MNLAENIKSIKNQILASEQLAGRPLGSVALLAVSKGQPATILRQAYDYNLRAFGENYWQEAREKQLALDDLDIEWHFIGPIQSNKVKDIAAHFHWVQSIDRIKIARLMQEHRPAHLPPLNVCLQVNLTQEEQKAGVDPSALLELADFVRQQNKLSLRGLMLIPPFLQDKQEQFALFQQLKILLDNLNKELGMQMDTLSMGMSEDLETAILAGSTLVRIGRALFGARQEKQQ